MMGTKMAVHNRLDMYEIARQTSILMWGKVQV